MADALWISEDYLMNHTVIADNSDMKVITPNILFVQEAYIKPLLGSDLFTIIQSQINAQVYTTRITTLMNDHLLTIILNYVMAESAHDFAFRWMNKGLMSKNSDNSQPIDADQLKMIRDRFKNRAEIFENRCKNFLIQENLIYPEYYNGNTRIDDIRPRKDSFSTGIYLGNSNGYIGDCDADSEYRKHNV